jgi:hypothetical protein
MRTGKCTPHHISEKHILESHTRTINSGNPPFRKTSWANLSGALDQERDQMRPLKCARSNARDQMRWIKCERSNALDQERDQMRPLKRAGSNARDQTRWIK